MMRKSIISLLVVFAVLALSATAMAAKKGDKGQAEWQGKMYEVEVMKVKGDQCYIHWTGYGKNWDEWKACGDIKLSSAKPAKDEQTTSAAKRAVGDAVQVNWKGSWYPARIIAVDAKKGSYKIHYDGYDSSWDEWVTIARMK
ncbi:MAG: Tudor-knot domain-containing protein [bacterium]